MLSDYREIASGLKSLQDLDPLMMRIDDAHHVLLGEASHGTHEYYVWRTRITKRLILEKKFNFIAVEGDWPDCYHLNRFIKGYSDQDKTAVDLLRTFDRWPTWMWANWEVVALIDWLKEHNSKLPANERVGFYGLDVYSLWESLEALMDYLSKHDPKAAELAKQAIQCFEPYGEDEHRYAKSQHYAGTVIAGKNWGAAIEKMYVPTARPGSIEEILHEESNEDKLLIFDSSNQNEWFSKMLPHRAIGVVYNPAYEKYGNYVPTKLNSRYDAFIYIDQTKALHPLHIQPDGHKVPETYPFEF